MEYQIKIQELEEENARLKEQLNKYLLKNKTYYEKNKDEHKQKVKEYQQRTNYKSTYVASPEQKKEYARRAYLKKKEKLLQNEKQEGENV